VNRLVVKRSMESIEQDSYSYYRLHEKIALVSLLKKEMRKHSISKNLSGINEIIFLIFN
jgi:hypothetical protein